MVVNGLFELKTLRINLWPDLLVETCVSGQATSEPASASTISDGVFWGEKALRKR